MCEDCFEECAIEFGVVERDGHMVTIYEVEETYEMDPEPSELEGDPDLPN